MVDRYTSECSELCHFPDDQGKWVYYDDYRELEAERDRLKCENEGLKGDILLSTVPLHEHQELRARHAALVEKYNELLDV